MSSQSDYSRTDVIRGRAVPAPAFGLLGALAALAGVTLAPGCACSHEIAAMDGGGDNGPLMEQGAEADAGTRDSESLDSGVEDAEIGFDGATLDLGALDAGTCALGCAAGDPCLPSECNPATGLCEVTELPDGTLCGEFDASICVGGQCVMRGCGDGFREPGGIELWPREGCDDRNMEDGDTCSAACEPTEFLVRVDSGEEEYNVRLSATGQMLVVDGLGNGLFVWVQHHVEVGASRQELRASRLDRYGNFLDLGAPLLLDTTTNVSFDMSPSAVGLTTGGFVVAWTASRTVGGGPAFVVRMRLVAVDGTLGNEQAVHGLMSGPQRYPRLAALTDSFVVVWEDVGPAFDVVARRFRNFGAPITQVFSVATNTADRQSRPTIAANGDGFLVAWLSQIGGSGAPTQLRARRFLESGPLGNEFTVLTGSATSLELSDVDPSGDSYLLAYTSSEHDARGDLYSVTVPRAAGGALGAALPLDTDPSNGAVHPHVAAYGRRELGGYVVAYNTSDPIPDPLFVTVGVTPPAEVEDLLLMMRGERFPAVAAAPYGLTGGSVWFGYTAQVSGARSGAVVFQLPPP